MIYCYRCRVCGKLIEESRTVEHRNDPVIHCKRICARDFQAQFSPRNANCGEIVSVNAGVHPRQIPEAMKLFGDLGIRFNARGDSISPNRDAHIKYLNRRGLVNADEIKGGRGTPHGDFSNPE